MEYRTKIYPMLEKGKKIILTGLRLLVYVKWENKLSVTKPSYTHAILIAFSHKILERSYRQLESGAALTTVK